MRINTLYSKRKNNLRNTLVSRLKKRIIKNNTSVKIDKTLSDTFSLCLLNKLSQKAKEYIGELNHYYDSIIACMPGNVYWLDRNCVLLGGNDNLAKMFGLNSRTELVGLTYGQMSKLANWTEGQGESFRQAELEVMSTGQPRFNVEEPPVVIDGKTRYYISNKVPIYNTKNEIIGVVGISLDITTQKESEQLKLENAAQNIQIQEQMKFKKIVAQAAHDGRSPISSLLMLSHSSKAKDIPQEIRAIMSDTARRVNDIFNNLLSLYNGKEHQDKQTPQKRSFIVSMALQQVLIEKKLEFEHKEIAFETDFEAKAAFSCLKMNISNFQRMLSNLINNAVDAFEGKPGKIKIHVKNNKNRLVITLIDNGKGMPESIKDKIVNHVPVTAGKESGNGIGFTQIWDTLLASDGTLEIISEVGAGTAITITFPKVKKPIWLIEHIDFNPDDIIVILDDDTSIHDAWETHLSMKAPTLQVKHFEKADQTIRFINDLSPEEKLRIFLLSDYELLDQNINGLDVIEKTQVKRSLLITSRFDDESIQHAATLAGTKILPKLLAAEITIHVKTPQLIPKEDGLSDVEVVIVDDSEIIRQSMSMFAFPQRKVEVYANSHDVLQNINRYSKKVLFCIDEDLGEGSISGILIAKQLYEQGFHQLYLFSGRHYDTHQLPPYLTLINKMDLERVAELNQQLDSH